MARRDRAVRTVTAALALSLFTVTVTIAGGCIGDDPGATRNSELDASGLEKSTPDGGLTDGARSDAVVDGDVGSSSGGGRCNHDAAFGAIAPLGATINTPGDEFAARLTPDELRIVFMRSTILASGAPSDHNLYEATRSDPGAEFGTAVPLAPVNSPNGDIVPSFGDDGKLLVFGTDRAPPTGVSAGGGDLWSARRGGDGKFGAPTILGISTPASERTSYLVDNGRGLYFFRDTLNPPSQLFVSYRSVDGSFGPAFIVPGVPTDGLLGDAVLTSNELTLYVKRDSQGLADIFRATRPTAVDAFGPLAPVQELNSPARESPTWVSDDDCTIYFSRGGGPTATDIFVARRPPS